MVLEVFQQEGISVVFRSGIPTGILALFRVKVFHEKGIWKVLRQCGPTGILAYLCEKGIWRML